MTKLTKRGEEWIRHEVRGAFNSALKDEPLSSDGGLELAISVLQSTWDERKARLKNVIEILEKEFDRQVNCLIDNKWQVKTETSESEFRDKLNLLRHQIPELVEKRSTTQLRKMMEYRKIPLLVVPWRNHKRRYSELCGFFPEHSRVGEGEIYGYDQWGSDIPDSTFAYLAFDLHLMPNSNTDPKPFATIHMNVLDALLFQSAYKIPEVRCTNIRGTKCPSGGVVFAFGSEKSTLYLRIHADYPRFDDDGFYEERILV